ncbi:MAG: ABC transporter permease [Acidimicrobiales bacterium]
MIVQTGARHRSRLATGFDQAIELSRRSIRNSFRNPVSFLPGLVFPLMLAAVYSAQFQRALGLPGFPEVDSFLDFILPASILQAVAFGATAAGADMALDMENGFFDRLLTSPVSRPSILSARLAGSAVEAVVKFVIILAIFLLFGASVKSGVPGVLAILVVSVLLAMAIGGVSLVLALRTGSQEAVNASFPLVFSVLFVSSAFFPTDLMEGWYQTIAENNPVTWIIDPVRRLVIEGWDWSDALTAIGLTLALAVLTISWATLALRRRLASL